MTEQLDLGSSNIPVLALFDFVHDRRSTVYLKRRGVQSGNSHNGNIEGSQGYARKIIYVQFQ